MFMPERPSSAQRNYSAQSDSAVPRGATGRAAVQLLARHGAQIMATARRYAATPEDAEDAYQRGLEILLTKAPTTHEEELVPWLKTVVKHEAFALRRQRDRLTPVTGDGEPIERGTTPAATHDQAERYERLSQGAEALRRLKPQEIRCLVLKAQGLSYREICEVTGWTYTKVNRCLTEGRQALTINLAGIEGGIECTRLAPLLSALADGEATADQLAVLRPHMKTCLACRARLREFRAAPARVAALVPAGLLPAAGPAPCRLEALADAAMRKAEAVVAAAQQKTEAVAAAAQQKAEALLGAAQHKTAAVGERAYAAAELVSAQKVAAVAASAAALAGGGAAVDQFANHQGPPRPAVEQEQQTTARPSPGAEDPPAPAATRLQEQSVATTPIAVPTPPAQPAPPPPPPDPANEFGLTGSGAAAPSGDSAGAASGDSAGASATSGQLQPAGAVADSTPAAQAAPGPGPSSRAAPTLESAQGHAEFAP
jgi:RNA polymerase sigma factor (sigma-70 family)